MVEKRRWLRIAGLVALVALVVGAFSAFPVLAQDGEDPEDDTINYFCENLEDAMHPVGGALAEIYGEEYETVMGWFCGSEDEEGVGFGQIMLALSTAKVTEAEDDSAEDYLSQRLEDVGWGEIWKELGLIGRDVVKPTRGPAWGQDDDFTPPGQDPDFVPPGQDEDFTPPGQDEDFTPPGQDEDFVPPGQMGRPEKEVPPEHAGPPDEVDPPMRIGPPEEIDPPVRIGPPDHANNNNNNGNGRGRP